TKWIILASIAFSVLLLLPNQILELYRIIYSDKNTSDFFYLHLPVIAIGISVWFASIQIIAETRRGMASPTCAFCVAANTLAVLLGALPMIACAYGLFSAIPARLPTDQDATALVGAIWGPMEKAFGELEDRLFFGALTQLGIAVVLAAVAVWFT